MSRPPRTSAAEARRVSLAQFLDDAGALDDWTKQARHRARSGAVSLDRLIGAALDAGYSVAVTPEGVAVRRARARRRAPAVTPEGVAVQR